MSDQSNPAKSEKMFQQPPFMEEPRWVPVAKRVRNFLNSETVADSELVMLKRDFPMVYFFPRADVNVELLSKSGKNSEEDEWGEKSWWNINTGGKITENAAWSYNETSKAAPENLKKFIAFDWNAMDNWFEEDEEVHIHPRDPYHRIDTCLSSRHVRIEISGNTVAETFSPVLLFETGLPMRFYIKKTDVKMNLLEPTDFKTGCPYKGIASYYSVKVNGETMENVVWTYPYPNEEVAKIKDLVAFFTEKLDDVFVDGKRFPKVKTKWSEM